MRSLVVAAVCVVTGATSASSQDRTLATQSPHTLSAGDRFYEGSLGFSWYSPAAHDWGTITHRRIYLTGFRSEWLLETFGQFAVATTMELLPLAIVQRTSADTASCYRSPTNGQTICRLDRSANVAFGAGGSPIGLKLYFNRASNVRLFAAGAAGALMFSTDVPVRGSRRLNFTFEYGGGMEILRENGGSVILGYKFHHISNGSTAPLNPGLDANVLFFGVRKQRQRR
jgi:opacity protein-like surface antigen